MAFVGVKRGDEQGQIDSKDLAKAKAQGWDVMTPTEQAIAEKIGSESEIKKAFQVGGAQFIDEALMGIPETIYDKTASPLDVEYKNALKKDQQLVNNIAGVAGGVTSLVAGPLGATAKIGSKIGAKVAAEALPVAMQSGILGKVAGKAIEEAAAGAITAAPLAGTELLLGDVDAAAETILASAGAGALFGIGGEAVKGGLKAGKVLADVSGATSLAKAGAKWAKEAMSDEALALNAIGITKGTFKSLEKRSVGNADRIARDLIDTTVMDAQGVAQPLFSGEVKSTTEMLERVGEARKQVGKEIGSVVEQFDKSGRGVDINDIITELQNKTAKTSFTKDDVKIMQEVIDHITAEGGQTGRMSFEQIQQTMAKLREKAAWGKASTMLIPEERTWRNVSSAFREAQDNAFDAYAENTFGQGAGKLAKEEFKKLRQKYGSLTDALNIATDARATDAGTTAMGFSGWMTGSAGATTGAVLGSGVGVLPGIAAGIAMNLVWKKAARLLPQAMLTKGSVPERIFAAMKDGGKKMQNIPTSIQSPQRVQGKAPAAYYELARMLIEHPQDTENVTKDIDAAAASMRKSGASDVADAMALKSVMAKQYISQIQPKKPMVNSPFSSVKPSTSGADIGAYAKSIEGVVDPLSLIDDLASGQVSKHKVEAVAAVYPKLHSKIQDHIMHTAMEYKGPTLSYQKRLGAAKVVGGGCEYTTGKAFINSMQRTYKKQPNKQTISSNPVNLAGNLFTDTQKRGK